VIQNNSRWRLIRSGRNASLTLAQKYGGIAVATFAGAAKSIWTPSALAIGTPYLLFMVDQCQQKYGLQCDAPPLIPLSILHLSSMEKKSIEFASLNRRHAVGAFIVGGIELVVVCVAALVFGYSPIDVLLLRVDAAGLFVIGGYVFVGIGCYLLFVRPAAAESESKEPPGKPPA